MPADEIYEKYLQKAITEINELGDEIARAAGERVPVLGSGHPLADVLLLKYEPQPSEVQEGVAFYGRAGQAILKSLQRLRVDPMAVYGTNCLKFAGQHEEEARPLAHARAAHRPAEARRRDGRGRARLPERRSSSRSPIRSRPSSASSSASPPTIEALVRAGHRRLARRAGRQDAVLERVQGARPLVGRAAAVLGRVGPRVWAGVALLAALAAYDALASRLPDRPALVGRRAIGVRADPGDVRARLPRAAAARPQGARAARGDRSPPWRSSRPPWAST